MSRLSAIVPAFNEGPRIGAVLDILTTYPGFHEVLVVDDGSTDNTEEIALRYPIRYIKQPHNMGKGAAMDRGVHESQGDVIFFADADIQGLTHEMIHTVTSPVLSGKYEMFVGMHDRKIYTLSFVLSMIPLLGGERALTRELWNKLPSYYKERFRIEPGLNFYAKYFGKGYGHTVIRGITRTKKEQKFGIIEGLSRRLRMYEDQLTAEWRLTFHEIPPTLRSQRIEILSLLASLLGLIIGIGITNSFTNTIIQDLGKLITVSNLIFALLKIRRISGLVIRG